MVVRDETNVPYDDRTVSMAKYLRVVYAQDTFRKQLTTVQQFFSLVSIIIMCVLSLFDIPQEVVITGIVTIGCMWGIPEVIHAVREPVKERKNEGSDQ